MEIKMRWKVLEEKEVFKVKNRLSITVQKIKLPNGKIVDDYYQIHFPESVVIVARTQEKKIILLKHYLHGFRRESIVLVGGQVEGKETALETAKRELLEETGYTSHDWLPLGSIVPHVNQICGKVHFFFADKARKTAKPTSNDLEDMKVIFKNKKEIVDCIRSKKIISMGTIVALSLAKIYLQRGSYFAK
mgnify:CR=1 FL=1